MDSRWIIIRSRKKKKNVRSQGSSDKGYRGFSIIVQIQEKGTSAIRERYGTRGVIVRPKEKSGGGVYWKGL